VANSAAFNNAIAVAMLIPMATILSPDHSCCSRLRSRMRFIVRSSSSTSSIPCLNASRGMERDLTSVIM
jgi:hypothetical protein